MLYFQFYNIDQFGLFKRTENGEYQFLYNSLKETLTELKEWVYKQNSIEKTKTFDFKREKSAIKNVYCKGLVDIPSRDSFLLTLWNEVPQNGKGAIATISRNESLTNIKTSPVKVEPDKIPGYPTYFWFLTDKNMFATLKDVNEYSGTQEMSFYIKNYFRYFGSKVKIIAKETKKENDVVQTTTKYRYGEDELVLYPKFEYSPVGLKSQIRYITKNSDHITKIIRKGYITEQIDKTRSASGWFSRFLHLDKDVIPMENKIKYKLELDYEPEYNEINDIVKDVLLANDLSENIGFVIDGKAEWLRASKVSICLNDDIKKDKANVMLDSSIKDVLISKYDYLLERLSETEQHLD